MSETTRPVRILHIQETVGFGGVERRKLSLARHLPKDKFQQKFICTHTVGEVADKIRKEGFELTAIGDLKHPFHWTQHKKVQNIIRDFQPHIVHGSVFEGMTMAAINGYLTQVPIILLEETSDPKNRSYKASKFLYLLSLLVDKVIAVSPDVAKYLSKQVRVSPKKIVTILNGVEPPRLFSNQEKEVLREKYQIPQDAWVIGSVGRMWDDEHKRFSDLIHAFAQFAEQNSHARLLLVGDGPVKSEYENLVETLNLTDKVIFTGFQDDTSIFYALMDTFVLSSAREAFGLVVAEAMLAKVPVVATQVGGVPAIIDHEQHGILIPPKAPQSILQAIHQIYDHPSQRQQLVENAYQKAIEQFSSQAYVNRVLQLYKELFKVKSIDFTF